MIMRVEARIVIFIKITIITVMGVGRGSRAPPPWIFKHGTNIIDRGLKVLFFGHFLLFFGLFSVVLPGRGK